MSRILDIPIMKLPGAGGREDWRRWIKIAPAVSTSGGGVGGRVLLISYTFPPVGGSGVQRAAKLAKYLPTFGWSVDVLAAGHGRFPWHDPTLVEDVAGCGAVHRVAGGEPACLARRLTGLLGRVNRHLPEFLGGGDGERIAGRDAAWIEDRVYWRLARWADRLGLGNGESLWAGAAVRAGVRLHRERPYDVVVSTGPPVFVHQVGWRIGQTIGVPWVADMRDPMVSDHDRGEPGGRRLRSLLKLERQVLRDAAEVVTTCESLAGDYRRRYPGSRVRAITNGFDRVDLAAAIDGEESTAGVEDICTLTAAGSFYGQRELAGLVEAVGRALDRHPEWRGRVRLEVAGTLDGRQRRRWENERPEWMRLAGYLDHGSALRLVSSSACGVLIVPDCRHTRLCLPGKMFELMALPVHVLGLVPTGSETEQVLLRAGGCTVAAYEDRARTAEAIERVVSDHFAGRLIRRRRWAELDRYDRRAIAGAWGECLGKVCGGVGGS